MLSQTLETHSKPAPKWVDQRAHPRVAVDLPGTLDILGWASNDLVQDVRVIDISANGAMVEVPNVFPYDVVLVLLIDTLGEFQAAKRWSSNEHTMGLKFIDAHPETYNIARS